MASCMLLTKTKSFLSYKVLNRNFFMHPGKDIRFDLIGNTYNYFRLNLAVNLLLSKN